MGERILEQYLDEFRLGRDLALADAETLLDAMIASEDIDLTAGLLTAWNEKGIAEDELFTLASIMRRRMKRLTNPHDVSVDIVGTGGSSSKTFNVSTAAAFVIAASGLPVAKHGNRAATSSSGSFDVLIELGIDIDQELSKTERQLAENSLCFMFAPRFHSLSANLAAARRKVGIPTIFNNLGPLCNPASVSHHVIGVWNRDMLETTANVLRRLGSRRSLIVHGDGGLDEIALTGSTLVAELNHGKVDLHEVTAADFGITISGNDIPRRCSPQESAATIKAILNNELKERDAERLVLMNAAAALYVAGRADSLRSAYAKAEAVVRNGGAVDKLAEAALG